MGCGRVGATLARSLEQRGHETSVIDRDRDSFRRLGPGFAGSTVTGLGFDRDVLRRAGIEHADAFAAVSSGDNSNIISARVAREQFAIQTIVARIYDPGRAEVYERLGVPTVATVTWAADQILRRLLPIGTEPTFRDPSGAVRADKVVAPEAWVGHTVREFDLLSGGRISHLTRLGTAMIPVGETVIQDGDLLFVFSLDERFEKFREALESGPQEA